MPFMISMQPSRKSPIMPLPTMTGEQPASKLKIIKGLYLISGNTELARDDFGKMISRHPADGFALCGMGNVHLKMNELDKAKEYFDRAITLCPDMGEAYLDRGLLLELSGDLEGA